jgi:hypothetical protein
LLKTRMVEPLNSPRGRLAQLGERLPYKQEVAGSSPAPPTRKRLLSGLFHYLDRQRLFVFSRKRSKASAKCGRATAGGEALPRFPARA